MPPTNRVIAPWTAATRAALANVRPSSAPAPSQSRKAHAKTPLPRWTDLQSQNPHAHLHRAADRSSRDSTNIFLHLPPATRSATRRPLGAVAKLLIANPG